MNEIRRISEISTSEYIEIVASWEYLRKPRQYGCHERDLSGEKLEGFKNRNGCGFRLTEKPRQTIGFVNFHSCFCDHLHPNFSHLLYLHDQFNKGLLPYPGSVLDQPNHIIELFRLLDKLKFEHEKELSEKSK